MVRKFNKIIKRFASQLTLFDYMAIIAGLVVLFVLVIFLFRHEDWVTVDIKMNPDDFFVSDKHAPYWLANTIYKGESEFDGLGRKTAEVLDTRIYELGGDRKEVYLKTRLRAVNDQRKQQLQFKGNALEVGSPIEFRFPQTYVRGVVTSIEGEKNKEIEEEKIIEGRLQDNTTVFPGSSGVKPWLADAFSVGDQMKDSQGRVLAEVIDKKVMAADKEVTTDSGDIMIKKDPIRKDVVLKVRLITQKRDGVNYFLGEYKIKVGIGIFLSFPNVDISPEIVNILK